ncbi:hypothetical protein ACGYK1_17370, partial [Sulfitobacter sp. 1A13191]
SLRYAKAPLSPRYQWELHQLLGHCSQDPDITLFELRDALADATGLQVHPSAIGHLLKRLGFMHKKSHWSLPNVTAQR